MVGLSIVLEGQKSSSSSSSSSARTTANGSGSVDKKINFSPQVISKATLMTNKPPSPSSSVSSSSSPFYRASSFPVMATFLQQCFLCGQKLLPGKDIYMYKGDRGFCSVECRCRQIFMDEEESLRKENCSLAAMKPTSASPSSSSSSSPSGSSSSSSPSPSSATASASRHRKSIRNRAAGFAIY